MIYTFAQVGIGIKAGIGTGNIYISQDEIEGELRGDNVLGYEAGAYLLFQKNIVYFRPEALYLFRQGELNDIDKSKISYHRIEVPLIFGIELPGPLAIEGGPTFHHILKVDQAYNNDLTIQKNGVGYRIGPALRFGRLSIYANYEGLAFSGGDGTKLKEPYRLNFGVQIGLGHNGNLD